MTIRSVIDECVAALDSRASLYIGFSGGLDSTVLLHALAERSVPGLCALHANHGLHTQSSSWQSHCQAVCDRAGVPLRTAQLNIQAEGHGLEAAARDARYHWFESLLKPGDILLLAHHQDDQVETLMLRLLRGAGPEGLGAMPRRRRIGRGELYRPLLALPRAALAEYARLQGLEWIDDPSNFDSRFDRNFLRAEIMPRLEARWPGYRKTLSRAAHQLRELTDAMPAVTLAPVHSVLGDPGFLIAGLPDHRPAAARALRGWLKTLSLSMPSAAMLDEFLRQLREGRRARLATPAWVIERYRDGVYAYKPWGQPFAGDLTVVAGREVNADGCGLIVVSTDAGKDPGQHFFLRLRRGGERLTRPSGQHSALKSVFQEMAVPPWWRARTPLLFRTASGGDELLAVGPLVRSPAAVKEGITIDWRPELIAVRQRDPSDVNMPC